MEGEPQNDFEMLKREITSSPENIEREFRDSPNPWLACVNTRLNIFMTHIELSQMDKLITQEEGETLLEKVKAVASRVSELQKIYPERENEVPEEIKQEILSRLNILG